MTRIHNGHVLGVTGLLAPVMGVIAPLGMPILLFGGAHAAAVVRRRRDHVWPCPPPVLALVIGAVVVWSVLSLIWTIDFGAELIKLSVFALPLAAELILADTVIGRSGARSARVLPANSSGVR